MSSKIIASVCIAIIVLSGVAYAWIARATTVPTALNSGDYVTARRLLLPMAKAGDADAQNRLGALYSAGLGGKQDYKIAANWMLKSALQGNSSAQINISHLYRRGNGVPKDQMRAVAWLWHARSNKNRAAENHLKWLTGTLEMTANQIQRARELYHKVEALNTDMAAD